MKTKKDDLTILVEKAVKSDPSLVSELKKADRAWDIALQIRTLRHKRNLTQTELAKLSGISQPNVARVESADYQNYSLKTLEKITNALNAKVDVVIIPQELEIKVSRPVLNF